MKTAKALFPFLLFLLLFHPCLSSSSIEEKKPEGFSGTVYSEEGKPIKEASVIALDCSFVPVQSVLTNEKGEFLVADNIEKICSLRIQKENYLPYDIKDLSPHVKGEPVHIVLTASSFLSGNILHGISFSPLKDISIDLLQKQDRPGLDHVLMAHQLTDERGEYHFKNISSGEYLLEVRKESFIKQSVKLLLQKGEKKAKDIFLFKKSMLKGSVRDLEGNPIGNARIEIIKNLSLIFKEREKIFEDKTYQGESSNDGTFALDEIPEYRDYRLSISADSFSPKIISKDIHPGLNALDIILKQGSSISGTIKDMAGIPVQNADIRIQPHNEGYSKGLKDLFKKNYRPSESGIFKIGDLPEGSYTLAIHSHDALPFIMDIYDLKSGENKDLGEIKLNPGLKITGSVEDEAGEKIESAKVTAMLSGVAGKSFSKKSESQKDGSFTISGLKEGIYTLKTEAEGYGRDIKKGIRAGTSKLSITLASAGKIGGKVLDEKGFPIEKFYIFVESEDKITEKEKGKYYTFSTESGHYEISDLKPGLYRLRAGATGFAEEVVEKVEASGETERDGIDFILKKGGKVEGYVFDKELHLPLVGAVVSVYDRRSHETITDLNGYFLLESVPMKMVSIVTQHPDYAPTIIENIDSSKTESYYPLKIFLEKGGAVEGYVLEADDSPIYGASLFIKRKGCEISAISDLNGFYHMEHIPPGSHTLVKILPRMDFYSDYESKEVTIKNNDVLRIDFKSSLEAYGHLIRKGFPVEGARVSFIEAPEQSAYQFSKLSARSSYTDSTGFYRIRGLKEGRYSVVVQNAEKRFIKNVDIPKVKEFHYDISYPEYEISGRVFDAESLAPLASSKITAILADSKGVVIFESSHYEEDGSISTISGATSEIQFSQTDVNGFFSLLVEKAGTYSVSASSQGYVSKSTKTLVAEGTVSMVELALVKSSTLRGIIRDSSGSALSVGLIYIKWPGYSIGTSVGADGRFSISDLEPATYSIYIFAPGLAPLIIEPYEMEPGKDYNEEFIMSKGGPLKIIVSPVEQSVKIQIIDTQGRNFLDLFLTYLEEEISVQKQGEKKIYSFPNLPPGQYKVILTSQEHSKEEEVEIYNGVASSVEFEF